MAIKYCVSLYSLQEDYLLGKRDLEGCIKAVANDVGCEGVEVLLDQMPLPSLWENDRVISEKDLDMWFSWMDKYQTVPASYGADIFTTMYSNRKLTKRESIKMMEKDLRCAAQLGFKVFRTGVIRKEDIEIFEACIPVAEELGIQIGTEIHIPRGIKSWWTQDWLEVIQRTGSKYAGFVPDFGIFTVGIHESARKKYIRAGAKPEVLNEIDAAHKAKAPLTAEDVIKLGGGEADIDALNRLSGTIYDNPEWLKEILPYTMHIHGKFYEIVDGAEPAIDYENPLRVLVENNWEGYISSEYEGQRDYYEQGCDIYIDPVEQCRLHQQMIKNYVENVK